MNARHLRIDASTIGALIAAGITFAGTVVIAWAAATYNPIYWTAAALTGATSIIETVTAVLFANAAWYRADTARIRADTARIYAQIADRQRNA